MVGSSVSEVAGAAGAVSAAINLEGEKDPQTACSGSCISEVAGAAGAVLSAINLEDEKDPRPTARRPPWANVRSGLEGQGAISRVVAFENASFAMPVHKRARRQNEKPQKSDAIYTESGLGKDPVGFTNPM